MSKKSKIALLSLALLVVLAAGAWLTYSIFFAKPIEGEKTIHISITHIVGEGKEITMKTREEYLLGALKSVATVDGTEGEFGLFVTSIDGEKADESKSQWWGYTKSGEMVTTGIDTTIIEDGDRFEFTLNEGY